MNEELIYRHDCDLFAESMDYESMIRDLMTEYGLTWKANLENNDFDEDKIYEFARELLQRAQNVIDSADTIAYEKEKYEPGTGNTALVYTKYLTYEENDE